MSFFSQNFEQQIKTEKSILYFFDLHFFQRSTNDVVTTRTAIVAKRTSTTRTNAGIPTKLTSLYAAVPTNEKRKKAEVPTNPTWRNAVEMQHQEGTMLLSMQQLEQDHEEEMHLIREVNVEYMEFLQQLQNAPAW